MIITWIKIGLIWSSYVTIHWSQSITTAPTDRPLPKLMSQSRALFGMRILPEKKMKMKMNFLERRGCVDERKMVEIDKRFPLGGLQRKSLGKWFPRKCPKRKVSSIFFFFFIPNSTPEKWWFFFTFFLFLKNPFFLFHIIYPTKWLLKASRGRIFQR